MPILNYTTTVAAEKTAAEIIAKLAAKGARRINQEYGESGDLVGIGFTFEVFGSPVYFKLPANEGGVERYMLNEARKRSRGNLAKARMEQIQQQARRTAWRILKDWVEAQIALVESEQAEMAQVFLPYAEHESGRTMFELFSDNQQKRLSAGGQK